MRQTPTDSHTVWARGLTRRFGRTLAVDGLDLTIAPGEFYGLLGPNGAGKTTTIKMIVGLLRPTSGTAGIGSHETWRQPVEVKRRIGVLPEEFNLYERLSGAELIDFAAAVHRLDRRTALDRRTELLAALDLEEAAHHLVMDYSRGMRKKVALAAAIVHAPPVLFLDEPFEGVDPISARLIRGLLARYTRRGSTVLFSSHSLDLVERLSSRIGIMADGRLLAEGTASELRARNGTASLEDAFLAVVGASLPERGFEWLEGS